MRFETAAITLVGQRRLNQDRYAIIHGTDALLLLLADGLGGHPRGEVAAQLFISAGRVAMRRQTQRIDDPVAFLATIMETAHATIRTFGQRQLPPIEPRTTAVAALIQQEQVYWCHSGDSRLYLFRDYQVLARTRDHSLLEQLHEQCTPDRPELAARYRNLVTHCLGNKGTAFNVQHGPPTALQPRDIILLCSDGFWSQFSDAALCQYIRHHTPLARMTGHLAHAAVQSAAPVSDNVTVVTLRCLQTKAAITASSDLAADTEATLRAAVAHLRDVCAAIEPPIS